MKRLVIVLCILLFPTIAYAAACISNGTGGGNWSNEATWTDASCGAGNVPGAADSATIVAGDTVTIDGNISVGAAPASAVTYNIDISGTLYWPNTPGADWTFTARSSIRINAGGVFQIADSGTPLNVANRAYILFDNTPANQKYKIYVNGGKFYVYGSPTYASTSSVIRARISSCNPNCNAGAGVTIRLDRVVDWASSTGNPHDGILIGIGGNSTTAPAAGDDGELITSWTGAATQITGVTLTENHAIGDIVVNVSRNVLFQADGSTYHSLVESRATNDPYDINWARFDEFGDTATTASGITFNAASNTLGTIDYVAVTNCEDGAGTTCFYINSSGWSSFEGNTAFDARSSGYGFRFLGNQYPSGDFTVKDCSYVEGSSGNASYGMLFDTHTVNTLCDGFWASNADINLGIVDSVVDTTNDLLHGAASDNLYISGPSSTYYKFLTINIENSELRNSGAIGVLVYQGVGVVFKNNSINGAVSSCFQTGTSFNGYLYGNTYDRCNTGNTTGRAGFELSNNAFPSFVYAVNESFGTVSANNKANILIDSPLYTDNVYYGHRYVCNDCVLAATNNPITCGVGPTDGIIPGTCLTYGNTVYIPDQTFYTLHNKDQSAGSHVGWGPGGMVISRETVTVVDNTLNVKVVPGNATGYAYLPLGTINVTDGQTVTVNVQLRKSEAQSAGFRPRLAVEGIGMDRYTNYDEMSDVNNTWETATVTGVATYTGSLHIYLAVRNNLSGANTYAPVWPPTIEIFADGISITKTGP